MRLLTLLPTVVLALASIVLVHAEALFHENFDGVATADALANSWGDKPAEVLANGAEPGVGVDGSTGLRLKLDFQGDGERDLSYWRYDLPEPMPLIEGMTEISFRVKSNVPIALKVAISPFGYIYHAPRSRGTGEWETLTLPNAWDELSAWCRGGGSDPAEGLVPSIIFAVAKTDDVIADVFIDDLTITGVEGATEMLDRERLLRRVGRVRVSVATQIWSDEGRTLDAVLDLIEEAALDRADLLLLPQECVKTDGEPIPGPISEAIAAKAAAHNMYIVGNIRESDGERMFVTSFLCDRSGEIIGKYRKSHKMPDEDMDLGDELPVFDTDLGAVGLRIGTDRFFADIDHVYTAQGTRLILWSQMPEPVDDEYSQDMPALGRALDYRVHIACARYANAKPGYITCRFPPYRGMPIGRSWVVSREGQRIACTPRTGSHVATATILKRQLSRGRAAVHQQAFAALTEPVKLPEPREWAKRVVRLTSIEGHLGIDELLAKLDVAGEMGSDLVCLYEFVWMPVHGNVTAEAIASGRVKATDYRRRIAEKADQWNMYVIVAGIIESQEINEAIMYDRDGNEAGRYRKIVSTYEAQVLGTETPILETDFARIGIHICADEARVEIDRCYGVKGADIVCVPTQSWGSDAWGRNLRDISRTMDAGVFFVECNTAASEALHRSVIIEPTGAILASGHHARDSIVSVVVDLDNDRPKRYIREWTPREPAGYLPQYQHDEVPAVANDLRETILLQRRPELYSVLSPEPPAN